MVNFHNSINSLSEQILVTFLLSISVQNNLRSFYGIPNPNIRHLWLPFEEGLQISSTLIT
jgi:hypothetical protein